MKHVENVGNRKNNILQQKPHEKKLMKMNVLKPVQLEHNQHFLVHSDESISSLTITEVLFLIINKDNVNKCIY